jgi:hypothetical protein
MWRKLWSAYGGGDEYCGLRRRRKTSIYGHEDQYWRGEKWSVALEATVIEIGVCYWASCIFELQAGDSAVLAGVEVELKEASLRWLVVD